jgi:uncharacterized membrane protein YbhN (UPF0104 family)
MFKKIIASRGLRFLISAVLVYLAFRRVNIVDILNGLKEIPLHWVILNILYSALILAIGSLRWSILLFPKVGFQEISDFTKATFLGSFYSLFFPTTVAGDLLKWVPLQKKYPGLTRVKLFSSVFLDRFIGFSAFILLAFFSTCIGKVLKYSFPDYLFWLFLVLFLGVITFYVLVFNFDFEKFLNRFKFLNKLTEVVELLKSKNQNRITTALLISFISEFLWIFQVWFVSNIFGAGLTVLSVFIFLPIIALILILPISIAGFGAREHLYLFFFSAIANGDEKVLLVSTFMGILGILSALIGGIITLFDQLTRK